ncbi:hypothetical protein H7X46_27010 [Pseudonocardia sp. C8]|uniref:hypothetical protein n=1 Tax=Pseudonocardia sp. C8 TaxID=2762759 RepID=UPI0016424887|nr:hypothetical protein [Pseudonocardia sp. C8]MBC3194705.1 hypothetical protein [Pseudonocardia sp. C8]
MDPTPRPTPEQYRRQRRLVDELLRHVEATGHPEIPWRALPALAEDFADDHAVLTHLAARWSRTLAAVLDPVFDLAPDDRERAAARITADLAGRLPALHAVLRRYADHPAVRDARVVDRARSGLAGAPLHAEHVPARWAAGAPAARRCRVRARLRTAVTA